MNATAIRAAALRNVAAGTSVVTVVQQARHPDALALRKMSLPVLLTAQPGWGKASAQRVLTRLAILCGPLPTKMTVGWLVDPRARRRMAFFLEALNLAPDSPWTGFPWTGEPHG